MMLEPAMNRLLKQVPSGYPLQEKPVTLALKQVADGEVETAEEA